MLSPLVKNWYSVIAMTLMTASGPAATDQPYR
jgi:hypothetical protein